jgi:hypothetical protein
MPGLAVQILPAAFRVTPGGGATLTIHVRNLSPVVDRYVCEVVGIDAAWWTVSPPSIELLPDVAGGRSDGAPSTGRFTVTIRPPRTSDARAGEWPIGVKITAEHTGERSVEESTIVIEPFSSIEAQLRPTVTTGRRGASAIVLVANNGNRHEWVELRGSDPEDRLSLEFDSFNVEVPPGQKASAHLRIRPADGNLLGTARVRPFQVDLRPRSDAPPLVLAGTFRHRSLLPGWLPPAAAVLLALSLAGFATWRLFVGGQSTEGAGGGAPLNIAAASAGPAPTPTFASETPSPTPTDIATRPPAPTSTAEATATPAPTPRPEPTPRRRLNVNEALRVDDQIFSPNGNYTLVMQGDGNLVLYKVATTCALWASNTANTTPLMGRAYLQGDGNLVVQSADGATTLWSSGMKNVTGRRYHVDILDTGVLAIFEFNGTDNIVWSSDDYGMNTCP